MRSSSGWEVSITNTPRSSVRQRTLKERADLTRMQELIKEIDGLFASFLSWLTGRTRKAAFKQLSCSCKFPPFLPNQAGGGVHHYRKKKLLRYCEGLNRNGTNEIGEDEIEHELLAETQTVLAQCEWAVQWEFCAGLARCGKSCRLRWVNYLRPDLKRGNFTPQEEDAIIELHEMLGNKWSKIASHFLGRTDNEIKNVWNTHLKKRLEVIGSNDNSSSTSSPNELSSTITPHIDNDAPMHHQGTTNDTIEYSSSSSTSFSNHIMIDDLNPNMPKNGGELKDDTSKNTENNSVIEIPFEPNLDLWELLHGENEVQFKDVDNPISEVDNPISEIDNKINNNLEEGGESWWWLVYLENELGLEHQNNNVSTTNNVTSNHDLC